MKYLYRLSLLVFLSVSTIYLFGSQAWLEQFRQSFSAPGSLPSTPTNNCQSEAAEFKIKTDSVYREAKQYDEQRQRLLDALGVTDTSSALQAITQLQKEAATQPALSARPDTSRQPVTIESSDVKQLLNVLEVSTLQEVITSLQNYQTNVNQIVSNVLRNVAQALNSMQVNNQMTQNISFDDQRLVTNIVTSMVSAIYSLKADYLDKLQAHAWTYQFIPLLNRLIRMKKGNAPFNTILSQIPSREFEYKGRPIAVQDVEAMDVP